MAALLPTLLLAAQLIQLPSAAAAQAASRAQSGARAQAPAQAPQPAPRAVAGVIDVTAFGADPTGLSDSTTALQAALDAAAGYAKASEAAPPVGGQGGVELIATPVVVFPSGTYAISSVLNLSRADGYDRDVGPRSWAAGKVQAVLQGEAMATIVQTSPGSSIVFSDQAWAVTITGLKLVGGGDQLVLGNNNTDRGAIRITGCKFDGATGAAIRTLGPSCAGPSCPAPAFVGSFSTQLVVRDCVFEGCDQALVAWSDWGVLADSWITTSPTMADKAVVENHGRLKVSNILGVPRNLPSSCPPNSTRQRWFDNYSHRVDGGMLTIRNFRFGGEAMGITAVVNWAPFICAEVVSALETELCGRVATSGGAPLPPRMRGAEGSSIIIESSEFGGGCGTGGCCGKIAGADIVLNELPSQMVVRDSWAQSLVQGAKLFAVGAAVDLAGAYARGADTVHKARPTYSIEMNDDRFDAAAINLPTPLRAYLSPRSDRLELAAPPATGSWKRGSTVWSSNSTGPLYWACVEAGWPGRWAPVLL